ncbi:MAG: winged helix DNA-binding domain-containing protein [Kofleriaceae bacterium]
MKDLAQRRVAAQWLVGSPAKSITDVARHMLATQAQEFAGSKWALGIRAPGTTIKDVDDAYAARSIVRAWPMRGTLHVCAAEDLGWLTALLAPRVVAGAKKRHDQLGFDQKQFGKVRDTAEKALAGKQLSREQMFAAFDKAKLNADPHRGYHMLWYLAQIGTVCMAGDAYALCSEWIAKPRTLDREEALGELAVRYFRSHGPATKADLQRWGKLVAADTKIAIELARPHVATHGDYFFDEANAPAAKATLALPPFDELILGYEDRTCTLSEAHAEKIVPGGNGVFLSTIVENGVATGIWKRTKKRSS